ncbi:MAG: DUF397 domain-containing protein [Pseudonocardia sp.]|nr:DUF397 domain-containing protein [Pseudonocardia sp.]
MNHQNALRALDRATNWQKASYSQADNECVEITRDLPGWIGVRDSKLGPDSPILAFTQGEWTAFLRAAIEGEFRPPTSG